MDGDRPVNFTPAPEKTPEGKLDFGGITVSLGHPGEDLGGVVKTVVDQVIQADVVVARQSNSPGRTHAATEKPGGNADEHEREGEQKWRQLEHAANDSSNGRGPLREVMAALAGKNHAFCPRAERNVSVGCRKRRRRLSANP
jgi:hypothetical protein